MAKRRSEQKDETRAKLVTAGASVFAQKGLEGTRIGDIAREAGVAMGTLYTHFPDKDALFVEVMRAGKETVLAGLYLTQSMDGSRTEIDRAAMAGVVAFAALHGPLFRLLLSRGAGDDPIQREVVDAIAQLRVSELRQGQADGWARPDLNPEAAARCEVGAVFHLLDWWLDDRERMSEEDLIDQLCLIRRFGVEGLIPPKET
ncbi:TetR/AcrR family transcriptional regulator [Maricaulis parjimensis]|uniref:TetR/AcrR family transcriptional regulator n=1 Tax=Maricaulis parjimensis TaxID=144023 RepID=UPI00193A095E|nr:TetR/AcrR family transcriptional regulator [Maricaulis parjimensis]